MRDLVDDVLRRRDVQAQNIRNGLYEGERVSRTETDIVVCHAHEIGVRIVPKSDLIPLGILLHIELGIQIGCIVAVCNQVVDDGLVELKRQRRLTGGRYLHHDLPAAVRLAAGIGFLPVRGFAALIFLKHAGRIHNFKGRLELAVLALGALDRNRARCRDRQGRLQHRVAAHGV